MAVEVRDVKSWIVNSGISHAVVETDGWTCFTACNALIWGQPQKERSRRICVACRKRLKSATLPPKPGEETSHA